MISFILGLGLQNNYNKNVATNKSFIWIRSVRQIVRNKIFHEILRKYLEIVNMSPWLEAMDKCVSFVILRLYNVQPYIGVLISPFGHVMT